MSTAPRERPPIGEAGPAQAGALVATLAAAFANDPAMSWIMPDAADRQRRLPGLFRTLVADDLARGWALASPAGEAVTLWRHSDMVHESLWRMITGLPGFIRVLGPNLLRGLAVSTAVEAHQPKGRPYHHLHFAGVDPAFQGRGWGGAAIRAGQDRARASGLPVFLETATPENVGLYQALGFRVTEEWDVPRGGPHFWSMLWEPDA